MCVYIYFLNVYNIIQVNIYYMIVWENAKNNKRAKNIWIDKIVILAIKIIYSLFEYMLLLLFMDRFSISIYAFFFMIFIPQEYIHS